MASPPAIPDPPLSDGNVTLRPWREDDIPAITAALEDPEIPRWLPAIPEPYLEEHARTYVRGVAERVAAGTGAAFAIVGTGGEVLGGIGFRVETPWRAEIGYWVRRDARGRGIASRALTLLSRWLVRERGFGRVQLHADVENVPSQRVAERAGFVREGVARSHMHHRGEARDHILFSLVRSDL